VSKYRKVYPRLWASPDLYPLPAIEKLVALYLLTSPQSNRAGLYRLSLALAADELRLPLDTFTETLPRVLAAFEWHYDPRAGVIWIPSWLRWNTPENVNVVKGLLRELDELPRTPLLQRFADHLTTDDAARGLPPGAVELFRNSLERVCQTVPKPFRNPDP
jgi:hypothetical protein